MDAYEEAKLMNETELLDYLNELLQGQSTDVLQSARDSLMEEITGMRTELEILECKQQLILNVLLSRDDHIAF